jgi:hypothetical protein
LFRYYSPNEKGCLETRIESVSKKILAGQGTDLTEVQALGMLASLHKACAFLSLSALSNLCSKKILEAVKKKNVLNPPQLFSEEVFEKNPTQAATSFLLCMEQFGQQEEIPARMEFFVQQLFNLLKTKKLTSEVVDNFFVSAFKIPQWSRDQKIKLMYKVFFEQKRPQSEKSVLAALAATIDVAHKRSIEWIYNIDSKFIAAMTSRPSFEILLERVSPIINNKDGFPPIRASFLLSLCHYFLEQRGGSSQKDCDEFFTFMSHCPKLTEETKRSILEKLQKDKSLLLEAVHTYKAKKDLVGQFFSGHDPEQYIRIFTTTFPDREKPESYLAKFYEGLLNDEAIPLFMKFYLATHLVDTFPRPEAGLERWKRFFVPAIVDGLS